MGRPTGIVSWRWPVVLVAVGCALAATASAEQSSQPAAAIAGGLDVGKFHSCAVLPDGSTRCWGYGSDGALGYANTATIGDDETPAAAGAVDVGAGRTALALSAGSVHTCAVLDDGTVRCWGFAGNGQLGYAGTTAIGDDEPPGSAGPVELGAGRTAKAITTGRAHSCAVLDDGAVRCWGFGFDGRLGYASTVNVGDDEHPSAVGPVKLGEGRTARAITAGDSHTCALLDDGTLRCWGFGGTGQLGYGNRTGIGDDETPDAAGPLDLGAGRTAVAMSAGDFHTCAVLDDGTVRCWGFGANGQLGYANTDNVGDDEAPATVGPVDLGAGRTAVAIGAGADHSCAVLDDGTVRCWGSGDDGRLGYANTDVIGDDETPGSVGPVDIGAGRTARAVSAGGANTCVRLDDDSVRCWGEGANGRLGSCAVTSVGDDERPGSVAPVDLGVPGSPGAGCFTAPPPPPGVPAGNSPTAPSAPPGARPPPVPPDATAAALAAERSRAATFRGCRRRASRRARRQRGRGRAICSKRYGRTPGRVSTLRAEAVGRHTIELTFLAPGTDKSEPPAARTYLIKQSRRRVRSQRDFGRAHSLCKGACSFKVTRVGARITVTVVNLRRNRTYYYAVAARDNVSARTGRRSRTASARTR